MLQRFLTEETGAVTVDWTVLAAAVVGMGLTSVAAVRTGVVDLGDGIGASLSGASVASLNWAFSSEVVRQSFADGDFSGWNLARAGNFGAWGPMLGPFGYDTMANPLTYEVALTDGNSNALIEFDMIISDTWDGVAGPDNPWTYAGGDTMTLMIDGVAISVEPFVFRDGHPGTTPELFQPRSSSIEVNGATYNVSMTMTDAPANVGGQGSPDQRWRVQIEATNAPQNFELGFSSTLDQHSVNDEAFGLQDFSIRQH